MADETETPEAGEETPAPVAEATPAEPEEKLHPKEARRRARSAHSGAAKPARTDEERQEDRVTLRKQNAAARTRRRSQERAKHTPQTDGGTPKPEHTPGRKLERTGTVVSAKPDKTITVRIDVARRHRKYKKIVRSSSKIHVHDANNDANEGDIVRVIESRPLSATKRWSLVEIVERAR
ncbi:MAG: 30S ribosomal protein S17 [Solirubrobacteraceae bacterium]|nr:30S ribosomal protein S17 [Solirubrobacteraceae bacterium]